MAARNSIIFCAVVFIQAFATGVEEYEYYMKVGDECEGDDDCGHLPNSECDQASERCVCLTGHVPSPNATICLKAAEKLGDPCQIGEQCKGILNAGCVNGTCVVAAAIGTNLVTNRSGNDCDGSKNDSDCPLGHCRNGSCVGPRQTLDLQVIGHFCNDDADCKTSGTVCSAQKCVCTDEHVPSQNLKACLVKAETMGDECTESVQCLALGGVCASGKCTEKMKSFFDVAEGPDEKKTTLLLGSKCLVDDDCSPITHSVCREKICECIGTHVTSVSSDSCLKKAVKEGDPCEVDKQCEDLEGATCSKNLCLRLAPVGSSLAKDANNAPGIFGRCTTSLLVAAFVAVVSTSKICFV